MRPKGEYSFFGKQVVIYSNEKIPHYADDLTHAALFKEGLFRFLSTLEKKDSSLLSICHGNVDREEVLFLLQQLARYQKKFILEKNPALEKYFSDEYTLLQFVEQFYNFWRAHERFFVCYSDEMLMFPHHAKPYSTFNQTVEELNSLVRKLYRDICENISGTHPKVYRQLHAAVQVGLIVAKEGLMLPSPYDKLRAVSFIKQVLIEPPLIIDPPLNKRTGEFKRIEKNPLDVIASLKEEEWLCYPAQVGDLVMHIYFNNEFIGLGTALSNLFELATDEQLKKKPDAVFLFGVQPQEADAIDATNKTVFFDDTVNDIFVGTVPLGNNFAYFGYLKKMTLTMHNAIMMKRGRLPIHGAMVKIDLKGDKSANVIIMGDTGAGKSESLEAFRLLAGDKIKEMTIIFDDMGSVVRNNGVLQAYGTETGAFVRLDDLQPGYAFGNIDRSIIMSPQKINARAVLPITTIEEVLRGHRIDFFLYANNYEPVDDAHPVLERFTTKESALEVFRRGRSMSKGTTTSTGITETYFVNIFGAVQYHDLHEQLAEKYFSAFFDQNIFVGQIRTRLGVKGFEMTGPELAAKALLDVIDAGK